MRKDLNENLVLKRVEWRNEIHVTDPINLGYGFNDDDDVILG
jgi:hypothetical protein